jgi:hypothetical protein
MRAVCVVTRVMIPLNPRLSVHRAVPWQFGQAVAATATRPPVPAAIRRRVRPPALSRCQTPASPRPHSPPGKALLVVSIISELGELHTPWTFLSLYLLRRCHALSPLS